MIDRWGSWVVTGPRESRVAHQWYGDSVAPETWSDLWLNAGHATWYEWTYGDEFFGGDFEFVARIRGAYEQGDQWRAQYGPVAMPVSNELFELFSPNVYDGGAVVLYALRQVIGDRAFERLEREWAQRYEGDSVGTEDFMAQSRSGALAVERAIHKH
jgi:aminopeptidase N